MAKNAVGPAKELMETWKQQEIIYAFGFFHILHKNNRNRSKLSCCSNVAQIILQLTFDDSHAQRATILFCKSGKTNFHEWAVGCTPFQCPIAFHISISSFVWTGCRHWNSCFPSVRHSPMSQSKTNKCPREEPTARQLSCTAKHTRSAHATYHAIPFYLDFMISEKNALLH